MQGRRHLASEIRQQEEEGKSLFDIDLPSEFSGGDIIWGTGDILYERSICQITP